MRAYQVYSELRFAARWYGQMAIQVSMLRRRGPIERRLCVVEGREGLWDGGRDGGGYGGLYENEMTGKIVSLITFYLHTRDG